ncbi:LysR substrate-binding domain-containing protein, partial [Escherichia coli]|nr:LysR substrate-binding domain-containing protein [Escherichia coli]
KGTLLCERGAELVRQFDALFEDFQTRRGGLIGTLKINAPLGFGRRHLAPVIADFQQQNPDVDVALTLSDQPLTETMDRFDVVVHIGELPVSNLVGYTIAPNARFVCAAPALVKRMGQLESPEELSKLPCIVLRENNEDVSLWQFSKGRTRRSV